MTRMLSGVAIAASMVLASGCGESAATVVPADAPSKAQLFLAELGNQQWDQAYRRLGPHLQQLCASAENLGAAYQRLEGRPAEFKVREEFKEMYGDAVSVGASTTTINGRPGSVGMIWEPLDGDWRLASVDISGEDLCG